jgi:polysaccharide export outer membrane protein
MSMASGQDNAEAAMGYSVLPGDRLEVSVWGEEDLLREVLVRPDGAFSFPLCGDISAKGKTVPELQHEVAAQLSRFISDPVVTITVSEVLGNKVYVIGQVNSPGAFVVNPNVDVLQALSMAGGTTAFASVNDIRILRRTGARQETFSFKYDDMTKGRNLDQNIVLRSGDVVIVP